MDLRKDRSLDALARTGNVAQFVSFIPGPDGKLKQQYSRVSGYPTNYGFGSLEAALTTLLGKSADGTINLRSYAPDSPRSRDFLYGIKTVEEAVDGAKRLASEGLFVIANETVDIYDGGVSGVVQGDIVEFAPDDTPRCVEKPGVASLNRELGLRLLRAVNGFEPDIPDTR